MIRDKTSQLHCYSIIVGDKSNDRDNRTLIQRTWTTEINLISVALWSQYSFQLEKVCSIIIFLNRVYIHILNV